MPRGGRRPGAGRKAKAEQPRLTKAIRFSPLEWARVEEQARRLNLTPSEFVRTCVREKLE